jgi:hypothetical protein
MFGWFRKHRLPNRAAKPSSATRAAEQLAYYRSHPPRCLASFKPQPVEMPGAAFNGHASLSHLDNEGPGVKVEGAEHINPLFWLLCDCGSDSHFILGHHPEAQIQEALAEDAGLAAVPRALTLKQVAAELGVTEERIGQIEARVLSRLRKSVEDGEIEFPGRNPDHHNMLVSPLALRCSACAKVSELFDTALHGYDAEAGGISAACRGKGERSEFACGTCGPWQMQIFVRFEYSDDLLERKINEYRGREQDLFSWFTLIGKCAGCGRLIEVADFECA